MKILIAGGTGFVGQAFIKYLLDNKLDYNITVLGRNNFKIHKLFKNKDIHAISWQELEYNPENTINIISRFDVVLNLCGTNIGAHRWSDKYKQEILLSRIKPTEILAKACADAKRLHNKNISLYNASAIGVYSLNNPEITYTEDSSIDQPSSFLSTVGQAWEQAANQAVVDKVRVVFLRFGVVLDWSGGALPKMALPFKFGVGGKVGGGTQFFTWIALVDLVRIIEVLISSSTLQGPINCVSPEIVNQQMFASKLAGYLHRPCLMPLPAVAVKLLFGQMGEELLLKGQKVRSNILGKYYSNWISPNLDEFFK